MLTYLVLGFLVVATYNAELTSYLTRSCFIHTFILQGLVLYIHLYYHIFANQCRRPLIFQFMDSGIDQIIEVGGCN